MRLPSLLYFRNAHSPSSSFFSLKRSKNFTPSSTPGSTRFLVTSILQLRFGSAMNDRPLSRLTCFSSVDSSASTILSLAARMSRLGAPPPEADFFTETMQLLAFFQWFRHTVPALQSVFRPRRGRGCYYDVLEGTAFLY